MYKPGERENMQTTKGMFINVETEPPDTGWSLDYAIKKLPPKPKKRKEPKQVNMNDQMNRAMDTLKTAVTAATLFDSAMAEVAETPLIKSSALIPDAAPKSPQKRGRNKAQTERDVKTAQRKKNAMPVQANTSAESEPAKKRASTSKPDPEPAQREESTPAKQSAPEVVMTLPSVNSVHVDKALLRAQNILNSISNHDSTKLKSAALMMVGEIIKQASDRVEGGA